MIADETVIRIAKMKDRSKDKYDRASRTARDGCESRTHLEREGID